MPTSYKVLGQSAPSATTDTAIYTCPSSTEAVVSTVTICNRGAADATFRIAVRPDGASLASQHYIAYDSPITGNDLLAITIGITVNASDVISVYASNANLTFNVYGSEIS